MLQIESINESNYDLALQFIKSVPSITNISNEILNNAVLRCKTIDDELRFNRDFLWMTINVINYYLEWDKYSEAQIVLENIGCTNLCPNDRSLYSPTKSGCGCHQ